jgi:hypothetical protein
MVQQDMHHKVVIIQFRLQSGLPVAFAGQLREAEELYRQLGIAIDKIKKTLIQTLHRIADKPGSR